jgi:hypothetical protein
MVPRGRLALLAAMALLGFLLGAADAQGCPSFASKIGVRKTVAGGKLATLKIKMTNKGAATVNDAGLALTLPSGLGYQSVKVFPKPAVAPTFQQQGNTVAWAGLEIGARKTRRFRIKLRVDKSAGDNAAAPKRAISGGFKPTSLFSATIGVTTFTGPIGTQACPVTQSVTVSECGESMK